MMMSVEGTFKLKIIFPSFKRFTSWGMDHRETIYYCNYEVEWFGYKLLFLEQISYKKWKRMRK